MGPWDHGTKGLWGSGTLGPWNYGTMEAWDSDPEDPDYPCGKKANGGAVTIYVKYGWDQHEDHDAVDTVLKKAGRKWGETRPPRQQTFMATCVRTLQETLDLTKINASILIRLVTLNSLPPDEIIFPNVL